MELILIPLTNALKPRFDNWQNTTETDYDLLKGNYGVLCGKVSNIIVLDVDFKKNKHEAAQSFIDTWKLAEICNYIVKTKTNGYHFYFKYDEQLNRILHPQINGVSFLDVMSNRSYVVGPGSKFSGKITDGYGQCNGKYEVVKGDEFASLNALPEDLLTYLIKFNKVEVTYQKMEEDHGLSENDMENLEVILKSKTFRSYASSYNPWIMITKILKKYGLFDHWLMFSHNTDMTYSAAENMTYWYQDSVMNLDIKYIFYLYNKTASQKLYLEFKQYQKLTKIPSDRININEAYLTTSDKKLHKTLRRILDSNKCTVIKSHMNSAKTTALIDYLKSTTSNVISVVSRVSLANNQYDRFKAEGIKIDHYQSAEKHSENVCTTIDSLKRFELHDVENSIVYLDEVASIISYVVSAPYLNSNSTLDYFLYILRNCKKIIATDADINDSVFMFFEFLNMPFKYIDNHYIPECVGKNFNVTYEKMLEQIRVDVLMGKKIVFCSDEKRATNNIKMILIDLDVSAEEIVIINADETTLDKTLYDVSKWEGKHILYSPSIIYGVDFFPSVKYNVYAYVSGGSIDPIQITQQIFRCRNIENIYTCISPVRREPEFSNVEQLRKIYRSNSNGEIATVEDLFNELYFYDMVKCELTKSNYRYYINKYISEKGYEHVGCDGEMKRYKKADSDHLDNTVLASSIIDAEVSRIFSNINHCNLDESKHLPAIKRCKILKLVQHNDGDQERVEKFKEYCIDDRKFNQHMLECYIIDLFEKPDEIKAKFDNKMEYQTKVYDTNLGKIELCRRIMQGENAEEAGRILKKQKIFQGNINKPECVYKILIEMNSSLITHIKATGGKNAKPASYSLNKTEVDKHKELRQFRDCKPKLDEFVVTGLDD